MNDPDVRRKELQDALDAAVIALLAHTGAAAFVSKIQDTPPTFLAVGSAEEIADAAETLLDGGFPSNDELDIEPTVPPGYYWHRDRGMKGPESWELIWIDASGEIQYGCERLGRGQESEIQEILNGELVKIEPPDDRATH